MRPTFQMGGMSDWFMQPLKVLVRKRMPFGPRCLSMMGESSSGPRAFEVLLFLMAAITWASVMFTVGLSDFFWILRRRVVKLLLRFEAVLEV